MRRGGGGAEKERSVSSSADGGGKWRVSSDSWIGGTPAASSIQGGKNSLSAAAYFRTTSHWILRSVRGGIPSMSGYTGTIRPMFTGSSSCATPRISGWCISVWNWERRTIPHRVTVSPTRDLSASDGRKWNHLAERRRVA